MWFDLTFSTCFDYRSSFGEGYSVEHNETLANDYTSLRWPYPLSTFSLLLGNKPQQQQLDDLLAFFHQVGGTYGAFRFLHRTDFSTNNFTEEPTSIDQWLEPVVEEVGEYQLTRWYGTPPAGTRRKILKPMQDTVLLSIYDGMSYTPTEDFTVDYETGIVTLDTPLGSDEELYGGCKYYIPVRFGVNLEQVLWSNRSLVSGYYLSTDVTLLETRSPDL